MKLSYSGLEILKKYEGLRFKPYLCPAKVPTIGYGSTFYEDGTKVSLSDEMISRDRAEELLRNTLIPFENAINRLVASCINQFQFDALVCFCYNVGIGAFRKSTLLKRVNGNPWDRNIQKQFLRWNKAGGKVLLGLTRRREEESILYFK